MGRCCDEPQRARVLHGTFVTRDLDGGVEVTTVFLCPDAVEADKLQNLILMVTELIPDSTSSEDKTS